MGLLLNQLRLLVLTIGVTFTVGGVATAAEKIGWDDLAPPFDESMDPFTGLDDDQQVALYELAMSQDLDDKELDEELVAYRAEIRQTLESAGHDLKSLLAKFEQYEKYAEIWRNTLMDEMDGRDIRMPGYVLPLEYSGTTVTEFLLVPYVGACIHSPPPPPNQIVHVHTAMGFESQDIFEPVWVVGRINTVQQSVSLTLVDGSSDVDVGYRLEAVTVEPYEQ